MSVDTYAICPCGSGKKIKFCKCKDSVGELDRVLKMVEGGQVVPALDRLAGILDEHPDAAWALAIRGRLLLDLREYDSLTENADRFIRLQPSNPLALTQRAAAKLFRGDIEGGTESMLEALTESGRDVDAFVLDVSSVLAFSLAQSGVFLTARVYATLALMAEGYQGGQTAVQVLRQLNSAASISQLLKAVPEPVSRPEDADWGERYDEAAGLLRSNKVVLAQSKFESLQRTNSGQPAVLSGLLTCAIWRGDTDAQSEMLLKLSDCESLDFETRCRYRAMAALVKPGSPDLALEIIELNADIENAEEAEMAMAAADRFVSLPADMLGNLRMSEDDVPPRGGFQIIDREKPDTETLPPTDQIPEAIAMVLIYGRQTDRSARLEIHDVRPGDLDEVKAKLAEVAPAATFVEGKDEPLPLLVASQPPVAMLRFKANPVEAEAMQSELAAQRMPQALVSLQLPILGGKSLAELAGDESRLVERTALMRVIEQYDAIASKSPVILEEVYRLAGLTPLDALNVSGDEAETVSNEDLGRIAVDGLDTETLIYLLQRSQQVSASAAVRRFAAELIKADLTDEQKPAKLLAYMSLINATSNPQESLARLDEAKAYAVANSLPVSNLLLSEVGMRLQAGDGEGFQKTIQELTTGYGNDPEVMAQLQQLLQQFGLIGPDGSPRGMQPPGGGGPAGGPPPAAQGGGLWTPDGGGGSPAPAADSGDGGGGSKLWVPGMD